MYRLWIIFFLILNVFAKDITLSEEEKQWLKEHPTITLGTDSSWAPYIVLNKDGSVNGYDLDILTLVNKYTGANFQLKVGSWKDMLVKAKNREIDGLSSSAVHAERSKFYNFSLPYVVSQRVLMVAKDNPKNIYTVDDLEGKTIGYQEKNLFDKKLVSTYKNSKHIPLKDFDEILKSLLTGKIDATLGSHALIYYANKKRLPFYRVVDIVPNSKQELVFSIRSDYPHALSILNKGLEAIKEEKKSQLYNKWFFVNKEFSKLGEKLDLTREEEQFLNSIDTIKVANFKGFPPFSFFENETPQGYSIDYIKQLAKTLGKKVEFISSDTWADLLLMLKARQLDIMPLIAKTKQREEYVDYTNFVHVQFTAGMAVRKGLQLKSVKDLEDKIIAVMNKSYLHRFLQKNFPNQSLLLTSSTQKAVGAVSQGQADMVIGSLPVLEYAIQEQWLTNVKIQKLEELKLPTKIELFMGVAKGNRHLKSILEKANTSIALSEVVKLKQKWMNIEQQGQERVLFNQKERVYLQNKKEIRMCVDPNWMPFEKIENNKHVGMVAEYFNIFRKALDTPVKLISTKSWVESINLIKDKKCDILSLATVSEKRKEFLLLSKPYIKTPLVIATKLNQPFINDLASISNKKIAVVRGYAYGEYLRKTYPELEFVGVDNVKDGLKKVQSGRLFALVGALPAVGFSIQKDFIGELKIAGKFKTMWDLGVAVRNDEPILRDVFNRVIATLEPFQHQNILNKWISVNYEQRVDYKMLFKVAAIFLVILALIIYRNISVERLNGKLQKANRAINEQQKMVDKYVLILSTNLEGVIVEVNSAYCKATGYTKEELLGTKHELMRHPDVSKEFFQEMWKTIKEDKIWVGEIKNLTKAKKEIFLNVYIEPIFKADKKIGYRSISENITDKKRVEKLSITDKLTGLYNRLKLDEVLVQKVQTFKRYNTPFSIILLDIDDFKMVNDSCGHDVGDHVLQQLSKILKKSIRASDTVGRWGGEEFVIICENTTLDNAYILAENLRQKISHFEFECVGKKTISLGVAQFNKGDNISSIFKRVDTALYKAKHEGKDKTIKSET